MLSFNSFYWLLHTRSATQLSNTAQQHINQPPTPAQQSLTNSAITQQSLSNHSATNNQSSFANITGLIFGSEVWGVDIYLTAKITATSNLSVNFHIRAVNRGTSWEIVKTYVGDDTGIEFNMTNSGQLQYTTANYTGFSSIQFKYRAITN